MDKWYKEEDTMEDELTYVDLCVICCQIAKGMQFLHAKQVRFFQGRSCISIIIILSKVLPKFYVSLRKNIFIKGL